MSKKKLWLLLSAFGIMFAFLSWIEGGFFKGILALILGLVLYVLVARDME